MRAMGQAPLSEPTSQLSSGALFADRYRIEAILGRGRMGTVYRARDLSLGEDIALKVLAFGPEPSKGVVLRFRKEVKLARHVTHPSVARIYDLGEHEGLLYVTMELIDGGTLRALLDKEGRLTPGRAAQIGHALAAGLTAAHAVGVVHRDIKPTNILIDREGRVVLSDFGIAQSLAEELCLTVDALGTPYYMAPEQAYGGPVDARTDLYALGRILYEMLTGERAETAPPLLAEQLAQQGIPAALAALTLRCLSPEPDARPSEAFEVERALAESAADATDAEITLPQPVARPSSREAETLAADMTQPSPLRFPEPAAERERALAVLPFLYRGSPESDYLGDVITDELVDILSRTRSLRVFGTGATARYREERDPRTVGRELGAFAVIDGTVQRIGPRVRISVRLADAASGAQLWSDHREGTLGDLFAFQEAITRRVAEELRVEITTLTHRGDAPAPAIEHYLAARQKLRCLDYISITAAALGFERCIELAPRFTPAFAGHAIACLRGWFFGHDRARSLSWEQAAAASVARARTRAPDLAETHVAEGMRATQYGEYAAAIRALAQALAIAPTCAEAHEYLGMLECEAGQGEAGAARLSFAAELNPELPYASPILARHHALHGRNDACDAILSRMEQQSVSAMATAAVFRVRVAAWRGDRASLLQFAGDERFSGFVMWKTSQLYAQAVIGGLGADEIERRFQQLAEATPNGRRLTQLAQLTAEVFAGRGQLDQVIEHVRRAAALVLIDLEWLDLCPLLAPIRAVRAFAEVRRQVKTRVEAIWTA
jgi:eukaryotic-like serine/threonine-protein kinase